MILQLSKNELDILNAMVCYFHNAPGFLNGPSYFYTREELKRLWDKIELTIKLEHLNDPTT